MYLQVRCLIIMMTMTRKALLQNVDVIKDPDFWMSVNHGGNTDEMSLHDSQPAADSPRNLENRLLNLIDDLLFNLKSPDLIVTRVWFNATLHTVHALYVMYTALMNGEYAAMEDALQVFEDVDRECINKHSKERMVDSFIEFASFRDGLTKLLEFLHRRLQLEYGP